MMNKGRSCHLNSMLRTVTLILINIIITTTIIIIKIITVII